MIADFEYPPARRGEKTDTFHGLSVADPYDWLGHDTPDTRAWLAAQRGLAAPTLSRLPGRARIEALAAALPSAIPERLPIRRAGSAFGFVASSNGGHALARLGESTEIVFDPAATPRIAQARLSPEFVYLSPSGRYVAAGLNKPGTDWYSVVVWDIQTQSMAGGPFAATAHPVVAWRPDEGGFYHNLTRERFGLDDIADGVWAHRLGSNPEDDSLVFDHRGGHGHAALPIVLADGTLLAKTLNFVTQEASLWLVEPDGTARELLGPGPRFNLIGELGHELLLETLRGAARGRIVAVDRGCPDPALREVAPEQDDAVLAIASHSTWSPLSRLCAGRLFMTCVVDAAHRVRVAGLDGRSEGEVELPELSTVLGIDLDGDGLEIAATSFLSPWTRLAVDPGSLDLRVTERIGSNLPIDGARSTQIFCESTGGARATAFVVRPEGARQALPTLLYVYGGWGQSMTPRFRSDLAVWLALGGAYAVAITRGGGEYGEAWRRAGAGLNKTNTFDDCCAVAEALVAEGVAAPDRLCLRGLSNGGLVVAACVNRRPELFVGASCLIPLVDVVHLLQMPAGASIAAEFGDPTADRATFDYLLSYSPLQNVRPSPHKPDLLIVAGEKDERAPPAWAYRYVAELQAAAEPGQAVLLKVLPGEAHGGWPPQVDRDVLCDEVAFLWAAAHGGVAGDTNP